MNARAMTFFIVTLVHPDGDGWNKHLAAHVEYLRALVAQGTLRASGPLKGTIKRRGFLILSAQDRAEAEALVANDPFSIEGLIDSLTIDEWDPIFGAFQEEASGDVEALLARAAVSRTF